MLRLVTSSQTEEVKALQSKCRILSQVIKVQQERIEVVEQHIRQITSMLNDAALALERMAFCVRGGYEQ